MQVSLPVTTRQVVLHIIAQQESFKHITGASNKVSTGIVPMYASLLCMANCVHDSVLL